MVVDGAEPREDEGALFESPGQFCRTKEAGKGEALSLDENGIDLRNIGETEMAPVTWKEDRLRVRIEGPRSEGLIPKSLIKGATRDRLAERAMRRPCQREKNGRLMRCRRMGPQGFSYARRSQRSP